MQQELAVRSSSLLTVLCYLSLLLERDILILIIDNGAKVAFCDVNEAVGKSIAVELQR